MCCPIHVAGQRAVEAGDIVIADVVVRSNGYWGDSAETHAVGASAEGAEARALLLDVLEEARTMLVPGAAGSSVFEHVHTRVVEAFPGGELPHHAGHGLGLGAFEDPHLIPADDTPFEPWMVIAVEPGVYFPGRFFISSCHIAYCSAVRLVLSSKSQAAVASLTPLRHGPLASMSG